VLKDEENYGRITNDVLEKAKILKMIVNCPSWSVYILETGVTSFLEGCFYIHENEL